MGIGFGPTRKTFSDYRPEQGATIGLNWRLATQVSRDRVLSIDTNWWKTFAATRLAMPLATVIQGGAKLGGKLYLNVIRVSSPQVTQGRGRLEIDTWMSHCSVHDVDRLAEITLE